jgi:hypothetical protein
MAQKHTPGPWVVGVYRFRKSGCTVQRPAVQATTGAYICPEICTTSHVNDETEANARLIAAAPDLLAALRDALESLRRLPNAEGAYRVTCIGQAEAAIKKAEADCA